MPKMNIVYQSIEGNTEHFVQMLSHMFKNVHLIRVDDQTDLFRLNSPYFCFVPTYIHGNHNRYQEVGTNTLHDELAYQRNYRHCLGFVGSGNRNFGVDSYCWTARYYSNLFNKPVVATYELRGDNVVANQIDRKLTVIWKRKTGQIINYRPDHFENPRLAKLKQKYGNLQ